MTLTINEPIRFENPTHSVLPGNIDVWNRADTFTDVGVSAFPEPAPSSGRRSFEQERQAFRRMLPMLLARRAGEFVAVAGGEVVDHDTSRRVLLRRYFQVESRRSVPVYVGYVGPAKAARQVSPLRIRRSA